MDAPSSNAPARKAPARDAYGSRTITWDAAALALHADVWLSALRTVRYDAVRNAVRFHATGPQHGHGPQLGTARCGPQQGAAGCGPQQVPPVVDASKAPPVVDASTQLMAFDCVHTHSYFYPRTSKKKLLNITLQNPNMTP